MKFYCNKHKDDKVPSRHNKQPSLKYYTVYTWLTRPISLYIYIVIPFPKSFPTGNPASALSFSGISSLAYLKFHIPSYALLIMFIFLVFQFQKVFPHKCVCYCGIFFSHETRLPAAYEIQVKSSCFYLFFFFCFFFYFLFAYALPNIFHITLVFLISRKLGFPTGFLFVSLRIRVFRIQIIYFCSSLKFSFEWNRSTFYSEWSN